MNTPHIVHLSTYPANDIRVFQKLCRSEIAQGFRVTQIVCHEKDEVVQDVEIRAVPKFSGRLSRIFHLSWKMYREALSKNADIYQLHHPDLILAGLLLKLRGKKVIYATCESFPDKILSMRWIPTKLRPIASEIFARYERFVSHSWDHIIVADRHSAQLFAGRPVAVVPNYPILQLVEKKHPLAPPKKHTVIYVGGLCEERGLGVMLEIAKLLRNSNIELELLGWCNYPGDEERIGAAQNVRYLGNRSLPEVYQRMADADLGLLLLQPVPAYTYAGENTNKLFEYMWCQLPVISSAFPNLKRIIDAAQCGVCVDPGNAASVARVIQQLIADPERRQQMATRGREAVVAAYNWPAASKICSEVYQNVLDRNYRAIPALPIWSGNSEAVPSSTSKAV